MATSRRSVLCSFFSLVLLGTGLTACGGSSVDAADGAGAPGVGGNGTGTGGTGTGTGGTPDGSGGTNDQEPTQRVVGYLPTWRNLDSAGLDLDTLTHICIAFANPTGAGNDVDFDEGARASIAPLVTAARAKGVKVLASIAGAAGGEDVAAKIVASNVDAFVASLTDLVTRYELDGIDVDIEGHNVSSTYEPFVLKLSAALPADKLLTVAVATWNGDDFSSAALAEYDFVNIMSYDHYGTWSEAGEHSSLAETESELAYWVDERGIPADKVVLGVPFYGYCWGCEAEPIAMTYQAILSAYPEAKTLDWISSGGAQLSFNSAATIATKAELAKSYGGIMIWELGQDATGNDALFKVIRDAQ